MTDIQGFIGIDVGGTKILGVVADPVTGSVRNQIQAMTPRSGNAGLVGSIGDVIEGLIDTGNPPLGIGVGLPGLVDRSGVLHYGPNVPGVYQLRIIPELVARFGVPVVVSNDATNAARAEHKFGAAKGVDDAVIITQGTGIGGALIVNGKIVRGANGFAGEPGHMQVDANGFRCACGRDGCWETVSSGAGLSNLARQLVAGGGGSRILQLAGGEVGHIQGEQVAEAFIEGDPEAVRLVAEFARWVAVGLGGLVSLLDPELIVLGGGLAGFGPHFLDDVRTHLPGATVGGRYRPEVPIVPAMLGSAAGAIGGVINASESRR